MAIKILLVDDDKLFRRTLSFHLEQAGYQVYTSAKTGTANTRLRATTNTIIVILRNIFRLLFKFNIAKLTVQIILYHCLSPITPPFF